MTVPAFPNLTFEDPTFLTAVPRTNLLCVLGRQGFIWIFQNDPNTTNKSIFLNLTNQNQGYDDCGLLGMAFHPEFGLPGSTNRGYVYVYYQYSPNPINPGPDQRPTWTIPTYNRLSRFTVPDGSLVADPNSELVLINQFDQHLWHNGGGMFFGSDGFLYLSNGDEGGSDDFYGNTQRLDGGLFSGVLRIDVDQNPARSHPIRRQPLSGAPPPAGWPGTYSTNYYIPNDNPFVNPDGSVLEEFFAIGFRSPHRMTFDSQSGRIWLGDVGDSSREEVDIIVKGGNYQWGYQEGISYPGPNAKPDNLIGIDTSPIYDYEHFTTNGTPTGNSCIIGGYVYRGTEHAADLGDQYIFGDNYSGRIWALTYNSTNPPVVTYLCNMPPGLLYDGGLSSFGIDQNNELYMCRMGSDGGIWKLARSGTPVAPPPTLLSQIGAFANVSTLSPANGLIPYNVNSPLWSDAAVKSRWIALPTNTQIGFAPTGEWDFPIGTVFVKHFELGVDDTDPSVRRRLETRVLVHGTNGNYYGLTYKWRSDNSDADLLTNGLSEDIVIATATGFRTQTWYYPSRQDCLVCHNPSANYVLGVKTRQLNGNATYPGTGITDNQLRTWNHLGMFNSNLDETTIPTFASLVHVTNTAASLDERVRSYIDSNCSQCHRPNGSAQANFDARYDTQLGNQRIINGIVGNSLGIPGAAVIVPSSPSKSIMHLRMNTVGVYQMPPLARNTIDTAAVATLESWINSLVPPSLTLQPLSQALNPGDTASFSAAAIGNAPLSYQWQFNGSNIIGATNNSLTVTNLQSSNEGNYTIVVSGVTGTVTSSNAVLTVNGPPLINTQPLSQSVTLGANVTFSVVSSGTEPLTYQWQFNSANIPGATTSTFNLPQAQLTNAGTYSVIVSNLISIALSSNATLVVNEPSSTNWFDQDVGFTGFPGSVSFTNGTFTVQASGNDIWGDADGFHFVYQPLNGDGAIVAHVLNIEVTDGWAKAGVMIRETLTDNSTHAFMALSAVNGTSFQHRATTGANSDSTGGPGVTAPYWVKLVRTGDLFTGYISADGLNWTVVDSITIPMTNNVYIGLALTAHDNSQLNTSTVDSLQFVQSITSQPLDQTVYQGNNATFNVVAIGAPLDYQWQFNGTNIPGANLSSYTRNNVQPADAGYYSVTVTNLAAMLISSNALLTVNPLPAITTQPQNQTVNQGNSANFSAAAIGAPPLSYLWLFNGNPILYATNSTYTRTNVQSSDAGTYSLIVTNPAGGVTSSNALLSVNLPPSITTPPTNQSVVAGTDVAFTVVATGTAPLVYQWQLNGITISGATNATLSRTNVHVADAGTYSVVITNMAGTNASAATLTVNTSPTLSPIADQIINEGVALVITNIATDPDIPANTLTFSLGTNAPTGATINPTNGLFSWTPAEAQAPGTNVITVIVTDNGIPNLSDSKSFTVVVNEVNRPPLLSPIANYTINEQTSLLITNLATDPDIPANALTFSLDTNAPAGATINSTNGLFSWTPTEAQGPSTNLITIIVTDNGTPNLSDSKSFNVVVNEVNQPPVLAPIADQIIHAGSTLVITNTATDPDLPANLLTYSLDINAPAGTSINPTNGVFVWTAPDSQAGLTNSITVRVTDNGLPNLSDSKTFNISVVSKPVIQSTIVSGNAVQFTWSALPGKTYRVQYKSNLNAPVWTDLPGDLLSSGNFVTATDTIGVDTQRFYRVVLVP